MKSLEHRTAAYLAKMPPAVAGSGGHAATFGAACRLVEFGLTFEQAAPLLAGWNETHCQPRWTEAELRHKLADAFKRTSPKPHLVNGNAAPGIRHFPPVSAQRTANQNACNPILARRFSPAPAENGKPAASREIDALAAKLREGTEAEKVALASLRGLSATAVEMASARGLLRFGEFSGQRAWFVLDSSRRVIQARRLDGQQWTANTKAWTLAGSQAAWPVGIGEAEKFPAVALCEGAPDLLAAFHFMHCEGREADCAPVAMLGGCARIHPDAVPMFAGKRVRIFRHSDPTGENAADRWAAQLAEIGATVDAFRLDGLRRADSQPLNDFNDLAAIHPDDFETHRNLWTLFDYVKFN